MRFELLLEAVEKAERRVDARITRSETSWRALKTTWREAWTPGRILAVGLAGGFLFARARPMRAVSAVSGTRWIQLATSVSGLLASLKAAQAAATAEVAASDAEHAAAETTDTVEAVATGVDQAVRAGAGSPTAQSDRARPVAQADLARGEPAGEARVRPGVSDARRRRETPFDAEPRPAEAATELSER